MLKIILVPSLHRVSGTPARQNPLFPPLPKGGRKGDFFAAFASLRLCSAHALRETFRASVAAVPRWVLCVSAVNVISCFFPTSARLRSARARRPGPRPKCPLDLSLPRRTAPAGVGLYSHAGPRHPARVSGC